jgi:U3 small nucleolar RNA-associated protein 18
MYVALQAFEYIQVLILCKLFFLDSGPSDLPAQSLLASQVSDHEETGAREEAAWSDSDDERREVSLVARPLLRKLRKTEAEDVITGKEYSRRLQKQYACCPI